MDRTDEQSAATRTKLEGHKQTRAQTNKGKKKLVRHTREFGTARRGLRNSLLANKAED